MTACALPSGNPAPGTPTPNEPGTDQGTNNGCYIHLFDGDDFDSTDTNNVINGSGRFATLTNLPGATTDWNGEMDSFKVGSAATVQVWDDENFTGDTQTYGPNTEQPDADEFSSVEIGC